MASAYPTSFRECTIVQSRSWAPRPRLSAKNGHHSESAPATRRRSFGPGFAHYAGSLCQDGRERMQRTLTPSRLPLAALRSLQRIRLGISVSYVIQRVHDSPVEIMGPTDEAAWGRERRLIMQRTLTPSRLPLAALRSLQRIRLGISVSYVIQRVHDSPVEIMGPARPRRLLGMGISVSIG